MTEREYVLVERDRWERVRESALTNGTSRNLQPGDLDPIEPGPVTLSDADREALARDICLIYDELDSGSPPPEGWCDTMYPQGWPYLLVDRLLTRWHIVRRTSEPGA